MQKYGKALIWAVKIRGQHKMFYYFLFRPVPFERNPHRLILFPSPVLGVVCGVWRTAVPELDGKQQSKKTGHLCVKSREAVLDHRGSSKRRWSGNAERSARISHQWVRCHISDVATVKDEVSTEAVRFLFRPTEKRFISIGPHRRPDSASGPAVDRRFWRPPVVQLNDCSCLSVPAPQQDRAPHTKTRAGKRWALICIYPLFSDR